MTKQAENEQHQDPQLLKILEEKAILSREKAEVFKEAAARDLRLTLMEPNREHEMFFVQTMLEAVLSELETRSISAAMDDIVEQTQPGRRGEQIP